LAGGKVPPLEDVINLNDCHGSSRSEQMASSADHPKLTLSEIADLGALADGTLDPARRASVEARIAASPQLTALYERERRVVAALHHARSVDRAPQRLRAGIEAARPTRASRVRWRAGYLGAAAAVLAAAVLALVLALPSGTPGGPSISAAAALAARGQTMGAPAPDPANPGVRLNESVDEVYFPNWTSRLRWRAVGERIDRLNGRKAVTVYYDWKGRRVAYTIVAAPALKLPAGKTTRRNGTALDTATLDGHQVVTWWRAGDTCLLSGSGVTAAELQTLAAWKVPADH
jgi:anti-sigma factor RsiW